MEVINNLKYSIEIRYKNDNDVNVILKKEMNDKGLESNSTQIGDVCITEETINGRILSGRYDDKETSCGYRYNYEANNSDYLISLNDNISIENAVNLINKTQKEMDFLSARIVGVSVLRNDLRVVILREGDLDIIKTAVAENENGEECFFRESTSLSKSVGDEGFSEKHKENLYKINDQLVEEDSDSVIKLKELIEIVNRSPNTYKDIASFKDVVNNSTLSL